MTMSKAEFIAECRRRKAAGFVVSGGYDVRDKIKEAGGIWDSLQKVWLMPDHASTDAMRALAGASQTLPVTPCTYWRKPRECQCSGRPGGYCCGRRNCQCYDCQ